MFEMSGEPQDFSWSELIKFGDAAVGTTERGAGEVIGFNGEFYVADGSNPKPRPLTKEMTPSGVVVTFAAKDAFQIDGTVDLPRFQSSLDKKFVDTDTFVYVFRATANLRSVEYQLEGPKPSDKIRSRIESGDSQEAVTIGTKKYTATNVPATLIGIRAPAYLNTVFEIPYHIHFLANDKSILGHVTALEASDVKVEWARTDALDLRYWDTK